MEKELIEIIARVEKKIREDQTYLGKLKEAAIARGELLPAEMPNTALGMAEVVMREVRSSMKTKEIAQRIQERFGRTIKPTSLATMLYKAAVQREETFLKDPKQKNTYRLRDPERPQMTFRLPLEAQFAVHK